MTGRKTILDNFMWGSYCVNISNKSKISDSMKKIDSLVFNYISNVIIHVRVCEMTSLIFFLGGLGILFL